LTAAGPVRLAVVGVGHLGRQHARVAAGLPDVRVVGVQDILPGRAAEVARELGLTALPDLESVAREADAAVVATPTASHAEVASYLLRRGRDVLIEKPVTSTVAEADQLLALARAGGRILQVGHVERYNPAVEAAFGLLSQPRFVEVDRLGAFTGRSTDVDVVRDLMIHDLQMVLELVGRPVREIRAAGLAVLTDRLDIANARIAFEGGCIASLTASRVSLEKTRKFRVFAPALYVSIDMLTRSVTAFRLSRDRGTPEVVPVTLPVDPEEPLKRELEDFARCVRERSRPRVPGEAGRDALALADRVREAIEEHRRAVEREGQGGGQGGGAAS
jgi:predicted dehydrogenase